MTPKIERWSVRVDDSNPYKAPEHRPLVLCGEVYGRDDFNDGDPVTTSRVLSLDVKGKVARTRNTTYAIGEPDPKWVAWLSERGQSPEQFSLEPAK